MTEFVKLLRIEDVSEITGVPIETLRYWRKKGQGPKAGHLGRRLAYRASDVQTWIDEQFAAADAGGRRPGIETHS